MYVAGSDLTHVVNHGPLVAAAFVAGFVGLVGFLSPCVLPLVPGYLSYVAGLSVGQGTGQVRRRMVLGASLFVLGFSAIFVLEGVAFGAFGAAVRDNRVLIERWLGSITIIMGLVFLGRVSFLQREFGSTSCPHRVCLALRCWEQRSGLHGAPA